MSEYDCFRLIVVLAALAAAIFVTRRDVPRRER